MLALDNIIHCKITCKRLILFYKLCSSSMSFVIKTHNNALLDHGIRYTDLWRLRLNTNNGYVNNILEIMYKDYTDLLFLLLTTV